MPDNETPTTPTDPRSLIDTQAIAAADAARDAVLAAHRDAEAALEAATKALAAATAKADAAAATNGDLMGAEAEVQHAELTVRAMTRRASAAAAAAAEAPTTHRRAVGLAHRRAIFHAIEQRAVACRAHEVAIAAAEAARRDFDEALQSLRDYSNAGAPIAYAVGNAARDIRSEVVERQFWTAQNYDTANERFIFLGEST
jgi:hypothetical protein